MQTGQSFHRSGKLVAAALADALGPCAHGLNRPSAAICAESNTTLHGVMRKQPARLLAYCCSVARAIACSVTVAREIALRNKISAARVLRRLVLRPTF
jgi:hypothetical protein